MNADGPVNFTAAPEHISKGNMRLQGFTVDFQSTDKLINSAIGTPVEEVVKASIVLTGWPGHSATIAAKTAAT